MPLLVLAHLVAALTAQPADTVWCASAAAFLRDTQHMAVAVERDTIDDWRTSQRLTGCRITAAGASEVGVAREAARLYERLRAAQWTRSPHPMDAPREASLRFRREGADCLFNVYEVPRLFTDAEFRVNDAVVPNAGEARYQVFVMCHRAMPAATRTP